MATFKELDLNIGDRFIHSSYPVFCEAEVSSIEQQSIVAKVLRTNQPPEKEPDVFPDGKLIVTINNTCLTKPRKTSHLT